MKPPSQEALDLIFPEWKRLRAQQENFEAIFVQGRNLLKELATEIASKKWWMHSSVYAQASANTLAKLLEEATEHGMTPDLKRRAKKALGDFKKPPPSPPCEQELPF